MFNYSIDFFKTVLFTNTRQRSETNLLLVKYSILMYSLFQSLKGYLKYTLLLFYENICHLSLGFC